MRDRIELLIDHLQAHMAATAVPDEAIVAANVFVFDSLGVALSGASHPDSAKLLAAASGWGQGSDAHVWGSQATLPAPSAALVNAFHIHNQEFDCVHERAVVHPMAVILAALLAYAERKKNVSGHQLLAAIALAVDVSTVIGMSATKPIRYFRPAQCGAMGAAAGMCVLGNFNRQQMRDAFGITYSQLAGTMQAHVEGTPTLALQVGFAARAAVSAVDLAAVGFSGPHYVLDGQYGYFALFEQDARPDSAFAELGNIWQITKVSHKPYPTGRAAHGGIAGLIHLMSKHKFNADDVRAVTLTAPPLIRQLVDRPMLAADMPISYARLCLPYLAAVTLVNGTVGLDAYTPPLMSNAKIVALANLVKIMPDDNQNVNALAPQHLTVALTDGRVFHHAMADVYGAPLSPMTREAQVAKFIDCCRHAPMSLTDDAIGKLVRQLDDLAAMEDIAGVISLTIPIPTSA